MKTFKDYLEEVKFTHFKNQHDSADDFSQQNLETMDIRNLFDLAKDVFTPEEYNKKCCDETKCDRDELIKSLLKKLGK